METALATVTDVVDDDAEELPQSNSEGQAIRQASSTTNLPPPDSERPTWFGKATIPLGNNYGNIGSVTNYFSVPGYSGTSEGRRLHLNRRKLAYQASKVTDTLPYVSCPNAVYPTLRSSRIKNEFAHIAQNFKVLDELFAMYFRTLVRVASVRKDLDHLIREARATICKAQHELDEHEDVVLGDLGSFCESVMYNETVLVKAMYKKFGEMLRYSSTDGTVDTKLRYLQDAYLDLPYWCLVLEFFGNDEGTEKELMVRVISHVKLDTINRRAKLLESAITLTGDEVEDIKEIVPILNGIRARLECLDNVWHSHAFDLETSPFLSDLFRSRSIPSCHDEASPTNGTPNHEDAASAPPTGDQAASVENEGAAVGPPLIVTEIQDKSNEVSINIGLIALIVLPSFFFGAYAFHISMASNEPGTFQDADFWNLLQSTIISSMGSLALAIGFFLRDRKKIAHWSTAYTIACLIWVVSLICGIVSVAIYTLINTAWSSMMSTLSSVLALLAPLLLILASTPEVASAAEPAQGGKQKRE